MFISAIQFLAKPGHGADIAAAAVELTGMMKKAGTERPVAWSALAGTPYGSFAVSARFDSLKDYTEVLGKVQADAGFAEFSKRVGEALLVPAETRLNKVVVASPSYKPLPFTQSTTVVISAGQLSSAMAWSAELLEFAEKVTGHGGVLVSAEAGRVGEIGFVFSAEDAEHWEALSAKLAADAGYIARMDQIDGMFEPGSDQRVLMQQIS